MEADDLFAPKLDNHFPNQATNIETIRIAITRQEESLKQPVPDPQLAPSVFRLFVLVNHPQVPHAARRSHSEANRRRRSCGPRAYSSITSGPHLQ
jgi:hypothetical protein